MPFFDEDARLARRVQRGDRGAFEVLLAKFERPIFSFIYHFFQNPALCEDLTQETFLRAFRFIDSYRPTEKWSTWLFSIARNLCIDELRKIQKANPVALDEAEAESLVADGSAAGDPVEAAIMAQEGEIVRRAVGKLPEKYRTPIILFYFNELSYEEIARVMNASLSNTKILLFRGKRLLLELYRRESRRGGVTRP